MHGLLSFPSEIKQKNEGGWEFYWDEESRPGVVVLEVRVQKFLDSSLIDVDVHPTYVSMVIKSKVRRCALRDVLPVRVCICLPPSPRKGSEFSPSAGGPSVESDGSVVLDVCLRVMCALCALCRCCGCASPQR
jgi:protein TilB